jgi:hypothetical protein
MRASPPNREALGGDPRKTAVRAAATGNLLPLSTEPQPQAGAQRATRASRTALLVAAYRARASEGAAPLCIRGKSSPPGGL